MLLIILPTTSTLRISCVHTYSYVLSVYLVYGVLNEDLECCSVSYKVKFVYLVLAW